jgi:hypothetical protein
MLMSASRPVGACGNEYYMQFCAQERFSLTDRYYGSCGLWEGDLLVEV